MAAEDNINGMKKSLIESINGFNLLVIPVTVGIMIFIEPVVKLLFIRGAFSIEVMSVTSKAIFFYQIGMIRLWIKRNIIKSILFFSRYQTPMINATIAVVMNIVLNIILSKFMGIGGLALATSMSAIFCTALLFVSFRKKIGPFGMKQITISFVRILVASLGMGVIAKISYNILFKNISANSSLIASIIIGALVYFIIIYFMKIEEVDSIIMEVKSRLNK